MSLSINTIRNFIIDNQNLLEKNKVKRIGIFGSFLHGNANENSDIDLLVEFHEKTFDNFMNVKFYFEDLLGRKVDLVTPEALRPAIKNKILEEVEYVSELQPVP